MRSLLMVLVILGSFLAANISQAAEQAQCHSGTDESQIIRGGDSDYTPWPSSIIRPFPWDDVQGIWKVEDRVTGDIWYFALKRLKMTPSCQRPLQVRQIEGESCKVIATGVGFDRNKVIRAQMTDKDGKTFRLAFTAFNEEDAPIVPVEGKIHVDSVVVLSIANVDSPLYSDVRHLQIVKVSNTLDLRACTQDIKK